MSFRGIDLSHWKTVSSWSDVKNDGIEFCYLKATQNTSYVDPTLDNYFNNLKSIGIPVGLYHYATLGDPVQEALHFKSILDKYSTYDLLPVLDLEEEKEGFDYNSWANTFVNTIGVPMMLYTGDYFVAEHDLSGLAHMPIWIAKYSTNPPIKYKKVWDNYTIWQYSDQQTCTGIVGNVDMNITDSIDTFRVNGGDYMMKPEDANKLIDIFLKPAWAFVKCDEDRAEIGRLADELRLASGQKTQNR